MSNYSNYISSPSFDEKLWTLAPSDHLLVKKNGALEKASLITYVWETIKGWFGAKNWTNEILVNYKVIQFLAYGVENNWINRKNLKTANRLAERLIKKTNVLNKDAKFFLKESKTHMIQAIKEFGENFFIKNKDHLNPYIQEIETFCNNRESFYHPVAQKESASEQEHNFIENSDSPIPQGVTGYESNYSQQQLSTPVPLSCKLPLLKTEPLPFNDFTTSDTQLKKTYLSKILNQAKEWSTTKKAIVIAIPILAAAGLAVLLSGNLETQLSHSKWRNLEYMKIFEEQRPKLELLNLHDLEKALSNRDIMTGLPLHNPHVFEKALPLLERLSAMGIKNVLSSKDKSGETLLYNPTIFEIAWPVLEELDLINIQNMLSSKDNSGKTLLYNPTIFEIAWPVLEELDLINLQSVLSSKDNSGKTLLYDPIVFEKAMPLLKKLEQSELKKLFSSLDRSGKTVLFYPDVLKNTASILEKLDCQSLIEVFLIQNQRGYTPLHNVAFIKNVLPVLKKLDIENINKIFSIPDVFKIPLIHDPDFFKEVLPILEELDHQSLIKVLLIQDESKRTALCHSNNLKTAFKLLKKLDKESLNKIFKDIYIQKEALPLFELHDL